MFKIHKVKPGPNVHQKSVTARISHALYTGQKSRDIKQQLFLSGQKAVIAQ